MICLRSTTGDLSQPTSSIVPKRQRRRDKLRWTQLLIILSEVRWAARMIGSYSQIMTLCLLVYTQRHKCHRSIKLCVLDSSVKARLINSLRCATTAKENSKTVFQHSNQHDSANLFHIQPWSSAESPHHSTETIWTSHRDRQADCSGDKVLFILLLILAFFWLSTHTTMYIRSKWGVVQWLLLYYYSDPQRATRCCYVMQ